MLSDAENMLDVCFKPCTAIGWRCWLFVGVCLDGVDGPLNRDEVESCVKDSCWPWKADNSSLELVPDV